MKDTKFAAIIAAYEQSEAEGRAHLFQLFQYLRSLLAQDSELDLLFSDVPEDGPEQSLRSPNGARCATTDGPWLNFSEHGEKDLTLGSAQYHEPVDIWAINREGVVATDEQQRTPFRELAPVEQIEVVRAVERIVRLFHVKTDY